MSFFGGNGGFGGGFDDPFFGNMHQQMFRQMQDMDNLMAGMMADPFAFHSQFMGQQQQNMMNARERMIQDGHAPSSSHHHQGSSINYQQQQMVPQQRGRGRGLFGGLLGGGEDMMMPFGGGMMAGGMFGRMFENMDQMKEQAMNDPNSHMYSHSTVISYDGTQGQPKYYEATNSISKAGDVKEERRTVRDSSKGVEKMKIGHHLGDRSHVIEKKRARDGKIIENQEFKNLKEDEAREFDRQFSQAARSSAPGGGRLEGGRHRTREAAPAIEYPDEQVPGTNHRRRTNDTRHGGGPIIEEIDDDDNTESGGYRNTVEGSGNKRQKGFFGGKKIFKA